MELIEIPYIIKVYILKKQILQCTKNGSGVKMWGKINEKFRKYPARIRVVQKMLELGIRISDDGKIYCGDLKINEAALAKVSNVDRRAIKSTIDLILDDEELSTIFKNIVPAGTLLKNIAKSLGLGVIEIESGEKSNGILASTSALIASKNINIRQAYAEDTYLEEDPVLTIITDEPVPGDIINEFLKLDNVKRVSIY